MPLHLVSSVASPSYRDSNPVSRLRYSPPDCAAQSDRASSALIADHGSLAVADSETGELDHHLDEGFAPAERRFDHAAVLAQAELEDVALVKLAAGKLAVALREVHVLLGRGRATWKIDAFARCTAKEWIAVQGDALSPLQTFRVTPEGYRAAGLRLPPFIS